MECGTKSHIKNTRNRCVNRVKGIIRNGEEKSGRIHVLEETPKPTLPLILWHLFLEEKIPLVEVVGPDGDKSFRG